MDKYVGKRLDGRYEIEEIIGMGGMAVVYKAHDNIEDRTVAIKILKDEFVSNDDFIRRFKNESKAIAMLSHQNIVRVYDVSFGDLIQYIVMEYIDGITLKEYIEHQGSLRWKDAVHFTIQILKALQHAHDKGIVHRDVKPQNIMVLHDGSIKVTDFGIARFSRSEQRTITDKAIGSVHYISPEQAKGEKTDEKADVYSVGVMLYEMLTGRLPFEADRAVSVAIMQLQSNPKLPTEINPSIPLGLEQITMHAMQKLTERRYQSAAEMLCDLERFRKDPDATFEYSYFVDNSPTRYVSSNTNTNMNDDDLILSRTAPEPEETKTNSTIPILAGVASALIVVLIVLAIIFIPKLTKSTGKEIACPNFLGKTQEEVQNSEDYTLFNITFDTKSSNDFEKGKICEQSQKAGKKLKKNSKITLYVSNGDETKVITDVYGWTKEKAQTQLEKIDGFKCQYQEIADDEVQAGFVVKTLPKRNKTVPAGSSVTVFVSTGKEVKLVEVPDVTGLKLADAEKLITSAGLVSKYQTRSLTQKDKEFIKEGYVINQDTPASDKEDTPEGTEVVFYVSDGTVTSDVSVSYTGNFISGDSFTMSLWIDGKKVSESSEYDADYRGDIVFKGVKFTSDSAYGTIKISESNSSYMKDYCELKILPMKSSSTVIKQYKPTKEY